MGGGQPDDAGLTRRITDCAPLVMFVVDEVGTITWANAPVERLFGKTHDEVLGSNILEHIDLEWSPEALDSVGYAMTASGLQRPMLFQVVRGDGTRVIAEVTANAQHDDPVIRGMVVYARPWDERWYLDQVLDAIAGSAPLEDTLDLLVKVMGAEILEAEGVVLYRDLASGHLRSRPAPGLGAYQRGTFFSPEAPWITAMQTGEPQVVRASDLPAELAAEAATRGHGWCWAWPVGDGDHPGGCLVLWRRLDEEPDHTCRVSLDRLVRLSSLVFEREGAAASLRHTASHDTLTGLANRAVFFQRLQDALDDPASGPHIGVLYIDLDGFKPVNDRLGHGVGDAVLREVGRRLASVVRDTDLVARIGGDEFTVLCPDIPHAGVLEDLAERLVSTVRAPIAIGDQELSVGASVGVAMAEPESCSIDVLIDAADRALYRVKGANKGGWELAGTPGPDSPEDQPT